MTLKDPIYLLVLLVLPVAALAFRLARARRRRFAVRLPTAGMAAGLLPREPQVRRYLPAALLGLGVVLLALALTRPQARTTVAVQRASVLLVTDASGSMAAEDVEPTRLAAVQTAVRRFLSSAPGKLRVGLLSYSSSVEAVEAPTTNHARVQAASDALQPGGGTATGDALAAALQQLRPNGQRSGPPAAIVLLSDGMASDGVDPVQVARQAKQVGVRISTVALGTPEGTVQVQPGTLPLPVPPDLVTLKAIAVASGGQAFDVRDAAKLSEIYSQLGRQLGSRPGQREITATLAVIAALLLLAGAGLAVQRRAALAVA